MSSSQTKQSSRKDTLNRKKRNGKKVKVSTSMQKINPKVAGIDLGSTFHAVAAPEQEGTVTVREFGTFTSDLYACATWLKDVCNVESIVMESTGVYWMNFYGSWEELGARSEKNRII